MTKNIGGVDRAIRIVVGLAILAVGWSARSWWGLLGLLPLLTTVVSWCPLYVPFKISTRAKPTTPA